MHQIPELENHNFFRSLHEIDSPTFAGEKASTQLNYFSMEIGQTQRRERIDSEDFTVMPVCKKSRKDIDFFTNESIPARPEEIKIPRKGSITQNTDPQLMQLEVK